MFATEQEIKYASEILLGNHSLFDDIEKRKIIECDETKDIKACPGSGKTTTLLAKLIILANKMPLPNNQGICVLTHTNIAIDEIKNKLGGKADILFKYPNHFGTIQSFVDKFLAIPEYINLYFKKPRDISDEFFEINLKRSFLSRIKIFKKEEPLRNKLWQLYLNDDEILEKIRLEIIENQTTIINQKTGLNYEFQKPNPKKSSKYIDWNEDEKSEIIKWFIDVIKNTFGYYGSLSYRDAYFLANLYLKKYPRVRESLSQRFKYLFIDEMQDTDTHQNEIIFKAFQTEKIVIQLFGDPYQSIYNAVKANKVWHPSYFLPINTSKRFGENIAKVLRTVCLLDNNELAGNSEINSVEPYIIAFDNPKDVLPKFAELVTTLKINATAIYQLSKQEKKPIKAIGWVGEPNKEDRDPNLLTIQSYFENYKKDLRKKERHNYDSLKSFLKKTDSNTVKQYYENIILAFIHVLSTANIKYKKDGKERHYTKTTFLDDFKNKNEVGYGKFQINAGKWAKAINNSQSYDNLTIEEVKQYLKKEIFPVFGILENEYITQFMNNTTNETFTEEQIKSNNIYRYPLDNSVEIEIANIHSVKGETHGATLYLETSYYKDKYISGHESERIMNQLIGIPYANNDENKDKRIKETLKMAYVGMSRPRYFLCVAIHKDRLEAYLEKLDKNININNYWKIASV